jgi:TolB-like protein/Tfp pilus assembly protein PilF
MSLAVGTRLGPYEIVALLGTGGMGEVYRARDPRLGRDVAIKILPEHLANDRDALARFEREAKAIAALSHAHILAIFDVGADQGVSYVVTELLEGQTLRARLRSAPIGWRDAVDIGAAIAAGLASAHSKGIIHRDLKPDNVFLTSDGGVKILDFGLARWRRPGAPAQDETASFTATEVGTVVGTVGYMSPEQVRGVVVDAPSDLFSLGCVLYEMAAGRRAFDRDTAPQTMTAILEQDPPPLSTVNTEVPVALERIVVHCLEKDPRQRLQSARDLHVALKDLLSGNVNAQPVARRRRVDVRGRLAAAVVLLALLAAAGFYWRGGFGAAADSIAVLPFINASGNAELDYLGDGVTESLINSLSRVPNLSVMSRNSVFRFKGREADAQAAGRALNVRTVLTGRVVQRGDALSISAELIEVSNNRQVWGEQFNRKLSDLQAVQDAISTEISDRLRVKLTAEERKLLTKRYTENTEAYQLYLKGRYYWNKKTPDGFNRGIEHLEKAIAVDPSYAPAYAALSEVYTNLANYNFGLMLPQEAWAKSRAAVTRALELDDMLAAAHSSLAIAIYQWEWDWPAAEREFKRAIELDPSSATTHHWYSHYLMTMGRVEESFREGRRGLELDPLDLANNAHQGWHYLIQRQYDQSIEPLQKAIELDPTFPVPQWYLGLAREQRGELDAAIAQFDNAVRITGGNRPSMLALLGHAYAAADRRSEAEAILERLNTLSRTTYVPSYGVAAIYAALDRKDEAFAELEKAYKERDSWMDYLGLDPRLDALRGDRRFADLMQRMKLTR